MASRASSQSEGEVLSSDTEAKATTTLTSRNGTNVDRHTRPYRSNRSPSSRHRRSRSRSPYRASHGEKRRREDEYTTGEHRNRNSPRTFNVRHEDSRHGHAPHASYNDRDHQSKRSRTYSRSRSRSPYRLERERDRRDGKNVSHSHSSSRNTSTRVLDRAGSPGVNAEGATKTQKSVRIQDDRNVVRPDADE